MKDETAPPMYTVSVSSGGGRAGIPPRTLTMDESRKLVAEQMHPIWRPMVRGTKPKPPVADTPATSQPDPA